MTAETQRKIDLLEAKLAELGEPTPGDVRRVNSIRKTLKDNIDAMRWLDDIGLTSKGVVTYLFPVNTQS